MSTGFGQFVVASAVEDKIAAAIGEVEDRIFLQYAEAAIRAVLGAKKPRPEGKTLTGYGDRGRRRRRRRRL